MRIATNENRSIHLLLRFVLLAVLLAGCGGSAQTGEPTAFSTSTARPELVFTLPATWTPEPTQPPGPRNTATITPTATVTATALGINNPYLTGVEALLPEGSRPMREKAWRINGQGPFWGYMILPVELANGSGQDVALLGLPRGEAGGWDRKTIYLLWLWSAESAGREPVTWQEIRQLPYAPEQEERAFLARDIEGRWHAVPLSIADEVTAGPLLPVDDPNGVFLAVVQNNFETLYILHLGERLEVYGDGGLSGDGGPSGEVTLLWPDTNPHSSRVIVVRDAPTTRVDGEGPPELMLLFPGVTGEAGVKSGEIRLLQREHDGMVWVAVASDREQFLEIDGDGFREFLLPDDINNPTRWSVSHWIGDRYVEAPDLVKPKAPESTLVTDWEDLPALPVSLYLRGVDGRWAVWPEEGGALAEATGEPPDPQPCTPGADCRSPDGRYQITALPAPTEPAPLGTPMPTEADIIVTITPSPDAATATATPAHTPTPGPTGSPEPAGSGEPTGSPAPTLTPTLTPLPRLIYAIRSGGRVVEIPGALNYTGTASFTWSPSGLLMGWAGISGGLFRVNPATGAATPLLETALCAPGVAAISRSGPCPQASTGMGVISPRALPDGAIGFAVQSTVPGQYPPPGVYRRDPDGTLNLLAGLRLLEPYCVATRAGYDFGQVLWSPDGEAFLYYSPPACLDGIVLLGLTDGSMLYDLSNLPGAVTDIRWGE